MAQHQQQPQLLSRNEAWEAVRTWPGLRGEPKLAWQYLFEELAEFRFKTITVTAGQVGANQGTSDRAGNRALVTLKEEGLIEPNGDPHLGRWTIYLPDPLDVARARRSLGGDAQRELFDKEQLADEAKYPVDRPGAVSAVVAPQPPSADLGKTSVNAQAYKTSNFGKTSVDAPASTATSEGTNASHRSRATTVGGSGVTTAGSLVERVLAAMPTPEQQAERIDSLAAWIREQVGDPRLRETPCLRAARAIMEGTYEMSALHGVLKSLAKAHAAGTIRVAKWAYFVTALERSMAENNRDLR